MSESGSKKYLREKLSLLPMPGIFLNLSPSNARNLPEEDVKQHKTGQKQKINFATACTITLSVIIPLD
jgi:hypothetical protein